MAKELEATEKSDMNPADLHKGSGLALPSQHWYIAECKPTRERTLRTMLQKSGYEAYVASQMETHYYKSRNKRQVEKVVIPSKIFVHTEAENLMKILYEHASIYRFMINRAVSSGSNGTRQFAFVPEDQMQQLRYVLGNASNPVFLTAEDLVLNQRVRVMRGPLAGLDAFFMRKGHASYIVVKVEMGSRHYAFTEVPLEDVQAID